MRDRIALRGGRPLFDAPLKIVRPSFADPESIFPALARALASGNVTNNGPSVVEFERRLSEFLGVKTLVFCNGQSALMTMLKAAGLDRGEVIVPSFTFAATPHAIRWCGATPVFADILDDGSFGLDPRDVVRRISSKTVAIVGVDPYGIEPPTARKIPTST